MPTATTDTIELELEDHRVELTAYCYRMLGSGSEAEDAVQETLTRAWRNFDRFEGRASVRTWLYRIATNVCFDLLKASQRRAQPMDLAGRAPPTVRSAAHRPRPAGSLPVPDGRVLAVGGDPAELTVARESIRLAFIAALQHLPPRQRAVLILREVLRWEATEVAELLDTTVASVNSALQRARATLAAKELRPTTEPQAPLGIADRELLARYVDAFERYDMDSLTALLHEDATQSMPPYELWLRGPRGDPARGGPGRASAAADRGWSPTAANGLPAFGQYRASPDGGYEAWALQLIEAQDGKIVELSFFLDTPHVFPLFGLPLRLEA